MGNFPRFSILFVVPESGQNCDSIADDWCDLCCIPNQFDSHCVRGWFEAVEHIGKFCVNAVVVYVPDDSQLFDEVKSRIKAMRTKDPRDIWRCETDFKDACTVLFRLRDRPTENSVPDGERETIYITDPSQVVAHRLLQAWFEARVAAQAKACNRQYEAIHGNPQPT